MNKTWMPIQYRNLLTVIAKKAKQDFALLTQNIQSDSPVKFKQLNIGGQSDKSNTQEKSEITKTPIKQIPKCAKKDKLTITFKKEQQKLEDLIRRKQNLKLNLAAIKRIQQKIKSERYQKQSDFQANPEFYQLKINQLASSIRKKVRKNNLHLQPINKSVVVNKHTIQNRQEISQNYKTNFQPKVSRVFNTQALQNQSRLSFNEDIQKSQPQIIEQFCRNFVLGIVKKSVKQGQQKLRHSFKFDAVKHKYPKTIFRERILKEGHLKVKEQELKQHQRKFILEKRKQLWEQSRKRCHKNHTTKIQQKQAS